jgi:hypothetical protein
VKSSAIYTVRWLPALTAIAYVATVAVMFPELVHTLYWDTDAAGSLVLAERLRGDGPVYIPHFGFWTSLWWLLATRHLPAHRQLWEGTGYAFALAGAGLLGWATARVAGRWAGVTAAAAALVVGPVVLRQLLTVNFHVSTPFTAAVLAAYVVLLPQRRSLVLAAAVGLLAGLNAASDPLLWVAGVAPFAIAAAVLIATTRRRDLAAPAGVTLALTILSASATSALMRSLDFHIVGREFRLADLGDLPGHVLDLGRMIALLGGANYALPGGYPREPLRLLLALLVFAAVAAVLVSALKQVTRRSDPTATAYACFWAAATVLLGLGFVSTTQAAAQGAGSVYYLPTLALAAGAGTAMLAGGSPRAQLAAAVAIAVVGGANIAGVAQGRAGTPLGAIGTYQQPLLHLLERNGVTRGYAGFWDAQNITWQTGMRLLVAPVARCGRALCEYRFFTISSWYDERPGPSFLIVDPTTGFITEPPPVVSSAFASYRFGPLTVYLFRYDLARHIRGSVP